MCFDGREIANYVLDQCDSTGRAVTNLSLQKIVYFCHVWTLIDMNKPLIKHNFEAWQHGPVLQYLYNQFKQFDNKPITERATKLNPNTGGRCVVQYQFDESTNNLLAWVVGFYSQYTASELIELSHIQGGPWDQVWNYNGKINPGMKIENKDITDFYLNAKFKAMKPYLIQ